MNRMKEIDLLSITIQADHFLDYLDELIETPVAYATPLFEVFL